VQAERLRAGGSRWEEATVRLWLPKAALLIFMMDYDAMLDEELSRLKLNGLIV